MNTNQEALHNLSLSLKANRDPIVNRNHAKGFARSQPIDELIDRLVRRPIRERLHQRQIVCSVKTDSKEKEASINYKDLPRFDVVEMFWHYKLII